MRKKLRAREKSSNRAGRRARGTWWKRLRKRSEVSRTLDEADATPTERHPREDPSSRSSRLLQLLPSSPHIWSSSLLFCLVSTLLHFSFHAFRSSSRAQRNVSRIPRRILGLSSKHAVPYARSDITFSAYAWRQCGNILVRCALTILSYDRINHDEIALFSSFQELSLSESSCKCRLRLHTRAR